MCNPEYIMVFSITDYWFIYLIYKIIFFLPYIMAGMIAKGAISLAPEIISGASSIASAAAVGSNYLYHAI